MAKRSFTAQQIVDLICQSGESSEELDSEESEPEDSDSEFEPIPDSDTLPSESDVEETESSETAMPEQPSTSQEQEESVATPRQRRRRQQSASTKRRRTDVPEELLHPVWSPANLEAPSIPPFTGQAGIKVQTANLSPIQFMELIITDELLGSIAEQTNLYAQQHIAEKPQSSYARPKNWWPTTVEEIKTFLGLTINMGITKKPDLKRYWSKRPIQHMGIFSQTMSRTRYLTILRFLHFSDNSQYQTGEDPNIDPLYKIRPLIDYLSQKFSEVYVPEKNISIDESLVHFTGRLRIKQYIPSKRARYGIKIYKLCESSTGFTCAFRVYEGKDSQLDPPGCPPYMGTNDKVVWDLIHPLLNKGYNLYLDNYYTSIPLFKHLARENTPACGTIRSNRKGFPQSLVNKRLKPDESEGLRSEEMLALKYRGKRDVYMLSTIHTPESITPRTGAQEKPKCVHEYSQYMGGVDRNDAAMKPYLAARKTRYWYKKLGLYLLQLGIYNSFILYKMSKNPLSNLEFQEEIAESLISKAATHPGRRFDSVERLSGYHVPEIIPQTGKKQYPQKKCRVCTKQKIRTDTRYHCPECPEKPGLCLKDCFKVYHTCLNF
ncbi:piggyBac transposable element-derived protein 4-like [Hyperolius riggenbachi]|uniref:piggyBac transposable element-derived protein 4-like n=1 Tax=Hyperolius riggenbachi TaxID=752182 RepID=UPI0035A3781E